MSITPNDVALASVATTALIGATTFITTFLDRRQNKQIRVEDRVHERELAHDERTYEAKRDTYIEMLEVLETFGVHMQETEPIVSVGGRATSIPAMPTVEQQMPLLARIEALGSHTVYEMYRDFVRHVFAFDVAVGTLRTIRSQTGTGMDAKEAWDRVEGLRTEGRQMVEKLAEQVRDELASPGSAHLTSTNVAGADTSLRSA